MTAATTTHPLPLAITMGDPAGIGPEIIAKWAMGALAGKRHVQPFVVLGDMGALQRAAAMVGAPLQLRAVGGDLHGVHEALQQGALPVLQACAPLPADLPMGRVDARAGAAAHACVQRAIDLALAGRVAGIVTAPLHKEALRAAGVRHPGHTEMLAERAGTTDFAMMLANGELRVLLVSIHLSLRDAIAAVTPENELRAIRLAHRACRAYGIAYPRVAVAGLNPHAGEGGLFGHEDRDIIAPAIAAARAEGMDATGPWPGDTVFMRARQGAFDIVVAQYHDQGLIPVKYLGVDQGVNITVGLPFVRTSVDHGTAFDIAGTGRADAASLGHAVEQAEAMVTAAQATPPHGQPLPGFIFMLTRHDKTIADALEQLPTVLAAGVRHIGFKDIGLPWPALQHLTDAIRAAGAVSYLEVVSQDAASELASARAAVALGVDVLMGGTRPEAVLPLLRGTAIRYYPFAGQVVGHPSVLQGTVADVVASARRIAALEGVHGLDLLAYRFEGDSADVPALIAAVCAAVGKPVVVAGSIDRAERIAAVLAGRAAGFTVGTAALDGTFEAAGLGPHGLTGQLRAIQTVLHDAAAQA
ncbi:4-hydroxythreonine-4-phosphate dehydrogenase PdxA [Acidovorax sp.]|uniref:4-hydroxythreonine-4-phosphate dehydrogenase PdxA n=1 Tax=Acidovorax sp. TaxID=1872122 RepID=UPI003D069C58